MKATLITPQKVLNPLWNQAEQLTATRAGKQYPVPQWIDVDAGYVLTGDDCWIHCCPGDTNAPPIAEPADAECAARVREFMAKQRPEGIAQIKQALENLSAYKNPDDKARLMQLGRAYGLIGPQATPPAASQGIAVAAGPGAPAAEDDEAS